MPEGGSWTCRGGGKTLHINSCRHTQALGWCGVIRRKAGHLMVGRLGWTDASRAESWRTLARRLTGVQRAATLAASGGGSRAMRSHRCARDLPRHRQHASSPDGCPPDFWHGLLRPRWQQIPGLRRSQPVILELPALAHRVRATTHRKVSIRSRPLFGPVSSWAGTRTRVRKGVARRGNPGLLPASRGRWGEREKFP